MNTLNPALSGIRRASIIVVIVCLGIAATIGIVFLFSGGWSTLHSKVIGTTLLVAVFGIVFLVHLSIFERVNKTMLWLALLGGFIATMIPIFMMWADPNLDWQTIQVIWKIVAVSALLSVFFTHANVMLLVRRYRNAVIATVLWLSLLISAILIGTVIVLILSNGDPWSEVMGKILGALLILWVLGTVVVPILGKVLRPAAAGMPTEQGLQASTSQYQPYPEQRWPGQQVQLQQGLVQLNLPAELIAKLEQQANAQGLSLLDYLNTVD